MKTKIYDNNYNPIFFKSILFPGGEVHVRLEPNISVFIGSSSLAVIFFVTIETIITDSYKLMELILLTDALKRAGVNKIRLECPYLPYARQDRVCFAGESLSLKIVCDIINAQHYESVRIWDVHSDVSLALLNNVKNVDAIELIMDLFPQIENNDLFVAPDAGATKRVLKASLQFNKPMITAEKIRNTDNGEITGTKVNYFGNIHANVLIIDDICDGGRTFIELAKELRKYTLGKISLYVTHGIFSKGFDVFEGLIDDIYVANCFIDKVPDFVHLPGKINMKIFPPHATDFYKTGHIKQYPPKTEFVYSNFTCRSDKHAKMLPDFDHKVVFFGLQGVCQYLLQELWSENFFQRNLEDVLDDYKKRMDFSGPNAVSTDHIKDLWILGYLPIKIKALKEGSRVDLRVPLFTIQNTHPNFYWLTNYIETQISAEMWKPITTATTAYEYKRLLMHYADITSSPKEFVPWQGHDFSARGLSGIHDQVTSAAGHLLSFTVTDTILAIDYLEQYYVDTLEPPFIGGSVPATEHSVMCMVGEDNEIETFRRLITEVYPSGIVSIVSDTWDFWNVITETAYELRNEILNRKTNALGFAKVVFRPDSGDPVKIICGDPEADKDSPQFAGAVECLWNIFGGTRTEKGYRVLDSHVGLIYGDSITLDIASRILAGLEAKHFASCNIVFGIGSHTYQYVTRDTFGTAIKATFGIVNSEERVLFKAPKTDNGVKNSARGLLRVEKEDCHYVCYEEQTRVQEEHGLLGTVFENGLLIKFDTISNIRNRLNEE